MSAAEAGEREPDWEAALMHLRAAQDAIAGEPFGQYVDVSTAGEALECIIEDVESIIRGEA